MAGFSIGQAIGAGFRVLRTHPLAVLWWAGAYLLIFVLPYLLVVWSFLPDMIGGYQAMANGDQSQLAAVQMRMLGVQPIIWLISLVSQAVLVSAMFRAVISPQDSRYGYLRLGRAELWVGLSYLALVVMLIVITIVVMIPVGIVSAFAGSAAGGGIGGLIVFALMLAACVVLLWIMLRLSMALPMAFAEQRFVLFRSWDFTKGQAGRLFLTALALIGIVLGIELVLAALGFGLFLAFGGNWRDLVHEDPHRLLASLTPWIVGVWLVGSVIGMAIYGILIAPWASIYQQLTADDIAV